MGHCGGFGVRTYEPAYSKRKVDITTASGTEKAPLITVKRVSVLGKEGNPSTLLVSGKISVNMFLFFAPTSSISRVFVFNFLP